jgi:hypothetical protein
MARIATRLVLIGGMLAAGSAAAQYGGVYGDSPPRPPADVPDGPFPAQPQQQYPAQQYPPPQQSQQQYPAQQRYPGQYPPPQQQYPPPQPYSPSQSAARSPSGIQAQPLPPPPGASLAPAPPPQSPLGARALAAPSNAAPPPAPSQSPQSPTPPQPADAAPQEDTVVTETPTQKIENGRAVFAGLDKITGRTISFDAAIGETVQFGALQVTARACYTRPPTEATNTDAFVQVDEVTLQGEIKRIFTGWMFASSPGLHAVEHPIYDVWLTDCAQPAGGSVAQTTAPASPPGAPQPAVGRKPAQPRVPVVAPSSAPAPVTDD